MAQAAELAQDHHLAANCTDALVLWNVSSCNIVRYVMESSEDMEMQLYHWTMAPVCILSAMKNED